MPPFAQHGLIEQRPDLSAHVSGHSGPSRPASRPRAKSRRAPVGSTRLGSVHSPVSSGEGGEISEFAL